MDTTLYENIIDGNIEGVNSCIKNGMNIYSRTDRMETSLYLAMLHGHGQIAKALWAIYVNDLEFIEHTFKTDIRSTFWIDTPILIGFGKKNIEMFDALYSKYQKCENDEFINMGKYVMFLLKRDNFKCKKVLMLSPTTREGKMLLLSMIKCVNANGLLDLNAETPDAKSLLCVSVQSGLVNMFGELLNYGAEIANIMEIVFYAIESDRIEFLYEISKRFNFRFYDCVKSKDYYWSIFKTDNWAVFKFVIERIIVETGLSWNAVLNLTVPFHDTDVKCSSLTVFEYVIFERRYKIAENCLKYYSCNDGEYNKRFCPIELLQLCPESEKLLLKLIEFDPTCLENASDAKVFFQEIVDATSIETIKQIYKKYPIAKKIYFKHEAASQISIDKLLAKGEIEKVACILENSIVALDKAVLSSLAYKVVGTECGNLFTEIISVKDFDLASLDTARLFTLAVQNVNLKIFNSVMDAQPNYDLNEIKSVDKNYNLLQILIHQSRGDNTELIGKFFDELIQHDVSYHIVCSDGKNLLHYSVEYDNYDVTLKLLGLGIDIDGCDEFGKLPVHYARTVKIFQLLNTWTSTTYENVATMYEKNTILHLCVASNADRLDLIKYLLDNGGNINASNTDGKTPIYYVHDLATAELISKYKPDINIVDEDGHSPLISFVGEFGHDHCWISLFYEPDKITKNTELRKYLGSRRNEHYGDSTFFIETMRNCDVCTNIMLELQCADMFTKTNLGNTPLHIAASLKKYDLIDKLVKRGLSLDTRNNEGETPFLVYMRTVSMIGDDGYKRLLKYNPKVNRASKVGMTALSFAIRQLNVHTYDLICELLLRGGNLLEVYECDRTGYLMEMAYEAQQIFRFAL